MKYLPIALVIIRLLIGPFLLFDSWDGQTSIAFIIAFVIAFFSDIFDGIIARKLGVSTPGLRQADSWADVTLYSCIAICAWLTHQQTLIDFRIPLLSVIFCQLIWWIVNLIKYGKPASYHTYSAKIWGITLFIATIALFGFNYAQITLWLASIVGIIHTLEEIIMTLILPTWTYDLLSLYHAIKIQQINNRTN